MPAWDIVQEMNEYYRIRAPWHDGYMNYTDNARMEELLPSLGGDLGGHIGVVRVKTQTFIDGLRRASKMGEDVEFF